MCDGAHDGVSDMGDSKGRKVFVSYSHHQGKWVRERLVPVLKAAGVEVIIDKERFEAGISVYRQMDEEQAGAERTVAVLSGEYLLSEACKHELKRGVAADPAFVKGYLIPVRRGECELPGEIKGPNPIYVDLRDDRNAGQWSLLLKGCGGDLGAEAPDWLAARDEIVRCLRDQRSVNLVVSGRAEWRGLIEHVKDEHFPDMGVIDLNSGATASRRGLVQEILRAVGRSTEVPASPEDLVVLANAFPKNGRHLLALVRFDRFEERKDYGMDLLLALRNLIEGRHLVLLVESRTPLDAMAPTSSPWTPLVRTVELRGAQL